MEYQAAQSNTSIPPQRPVHKRGKSSSVLKSIMITRGHKRSPSNERPLSTEYNQSAARDLVSLQSNHPYSTQRPLSELYNHNDGTAASRKSKDFKESRPLGLHKKALSTVSLRSLGREKDKEPKEPKRCIPEGDPVKKPKKTKSSTSLSRVFGKHKTAKASEDAPVLRPKDKENTTPPRSAIEPTHTPIWAQFASTGVEQSSTTKIPLNDSHQLTNEISHYPLTNYSSSRQQGSQDYGLPTLQPRTRRERPKSEFISSNYSAVMSQDQPKAGGAMSFLKRSSSDKKKEKKQSKPDTTAATATKRGTRVMAVVAAFNSKAKEIGSESKLDSKTIDAEFEAVLDSRNIPENMRPKMRSLTTTVKADFIKKNKLIIMGTTAEQGNTPTGENITRKSMSQSRNNSFESGNSGAANEELESSSSKHTRSRSKTFTFSKGDGPNKKQKSENGTRSARSSKSIDIPKSPSVRDLLATGGASGPSSPVKATRSVMPEDYVTYLCKTQAPQNVEVGRLHKLRQLIRNETVAWVDSFIKLGGMGEIVKLLHRIMEIEWREDHEDALLHNALLCLKGLCTTALALQELCTYAPTLFPALLGMLFDDEHRGPSEFNTRGLVVAILFAHLSSASAAELPSRARTILGYLHDPIPSESAQPLPFILEMRTSRPYRVWCREVSNVTKEVFWIFLHHLNVVAMPNSPSEDVEPTSYLKTHFPGLREPVPAAPYIGGVEWDATNYLATHLDLLNGIIASLPTIAERNSLRQELKDSGWEKVMGASLRTCKEKFYNSVHEGLRTWVAAAVEDDWPVKMVRMGEGINQSPVKSPVKSKKKAEPAPKLELPSLGVSKSSDVRLDDWI